MKMTLNGWQRLWILVSVVLLGIFAAVGTVLFPSESSVPHSLAFESVLSSEARAQIAQPGDAGPVEVRMPNGHRIPLKPGIEASRSTVVLSEYSAELQRQLRNKRSWFIAYVVCAWLAFCASIYLVGWLVGWVSRGFKSGRVAL